MAKEEKPKEENPKDEQKKKLPLPIWFFILIFIVFLAGFFFLLPQTRNLVLKQEIPQDSLNDSLLSIDTLISTIIDTTEDYEEINFNILDTISPLDPSTHLMWNIRLASLKASENIYILDSIIIRAQTLKVQMSAVNLHLDALYDSVSRINKLTGEAYIDALSVAEQLLQQEHYQVKATRDSLDLLRAQIVHRLLELESMEIQEDTLSEISEINTEENYVKLVSLFGNMRAEDAANIMQALDDPLLLEIFSRMNPRKGAKILSKFDPVRAARITDKLSTMQQLIEKPEE